MGLLDKLTTNQSTLTPYAGATPPTNPLATDASKMHADGNQPGYSLTGAQTSAVNAQYNQYIDGTLNALPLPSQLDLNGVPPVVPGKYPYLNNLPG